MSSQLEVVVSRLRIPPILSSSGLQDEGFLSEDLLLRGGLDLGTGPGLGLGDLGGLLEVWRGERDLGGLLGGLWCVGGLLGGGLL